LPSTKKPLKNPEKAVAKEGAHMVFLAAGTTWAFKNLLFPYWTSRLPGFFSEGALETKTWP
jgi:hypothetical protein